MAHEEAVSNQHSAVSENQHQNPLTPKDTKDTKENQGLPQINGDEQGPVKQRAEALALKLAQTYEELTRLLERNPGVKRQMTEGESKQDKVYQKLKQRLKLADMAPRCQWVRQDGTSCGSPQMKQHIYCFAHMQMAGARELMLKLPPPEDANAIQIGLMRIQKSLIEGTISTKIAGLLLYSMQLALTNVGQTTFGKAKDEEMVRETVDEEEALSNQQSAISQDQPQNQTFEIQRNGGSGGAEGLLRMDADERGLDNLRNPIEWKPTADMYRMDTREGMEAYEANFRMKIAPWLDRAGTPPRAAVHPSKPKPGFHPRTRKSRVQGTPGLPGTPAVPHEHGLPNEHAEVHANLCPSTRKARVDGARLG
jgi:hypothetical protein